MTLIIAFTSLNQISFLSYLLKTVFFLGSFGGLSGNLLSGNNEGLFVSIFILSLLLLLQGLRRDSCVLLYLGCFLFGFYVSLKIIFFPIMLGLVFLPLSFRKKTNSLVFCIMGLLLPLVYSFIFQNTLLYEYYLYITRQTKTTGTTNIVASFFDKNQTIEACRFATNNLPCLFHFYAQKIFPTFKSTLGLWVFIVYFLFALGTLTLILTKVWKVVPILNNKNNQLSIKRLYSWILELNEFIVLNQRFGAYIFILSLYTIYIFLPRMPMYYFLSLSAMGAYLLEDFKLPKKIIILLISISIPYFFGVGLNKMYTSLIGYYSQILPAFIAFIFFILNIDNPELLKKEK